MEEFKVGYKDQVVGENPLMSVVVIDDTVRVLITALRAKSDEVCSAPLEIDPLDKVLKYPFCEKISVSTIVETGTSVIVEAK
jgi:hypothetical protein